VTDTGPIEVNGSLVPGATWMTLRCLVYAGSGLLFSHFTQNAEVVQACMVAVGGLLTYSYSFWRERHMRHKLVKLADMLPDEKAVVK
jgi:hypothetical protein